MSGGLSEQAIGEAVKAAEKRFAELVEYWEEAYMFDGSVPGELLKAALPVLLESGELVTRACLEDVERERDLAIAHDRQPYPTAHAYESVCAAREKWQERAVRAERALADCKEALEWIRDHGHDEDALLERAACENGWHTDERHMRGSGPDPLGETCPECHSEWWACDGTDPAEEGSYALQAVARQALARLGSEAGE